MSDLTWLFRISGALVLIVLSAGISRWQRAGMEKEILTASARAFVQLILIGYALNLIFAARNSFWIVLLVGVMITIAGFTAGARARQIPHSRAIAWLSIGTGTFLTMGLLIGLHVFVFDAQFVIPIAGMVVGNSMVVTGLVMSCLWDDLKLQRSRIEASLALGATSRQAVEGALRRALKTGMAPIVDNTKTVGLISLPGAMTGMILAGASPLKAVQLQIIVMYMLIGASAFSGLTAVFLTYPGFFTKTHQLDMSASKKE